MFTWPRTKREECQKTPDPPRSTADRNEKETGPPVVNRTEERRKENKKKRKGKIKWNM